MIDGKRKINMTCEGSRLFGSLLWKHYVRRRAKGWYAPIKQTEISDDYIAFNWKMNSSEKIGNVNVHCRACKVQSFKVSTKIECLSKGVGLIVIESDPGAIPCCHTTYPILFIILLKNGPEAPAALTTEPRHAKRALSEALTYYNWEMTSYFRGKKSTRVFIKMLCGLQGFTAF